MTVFDYGVIGTVVVSAALGWWRGIVYELVSLMGWIMAGLLAWMFAFNLAPYMPDMFGDPTTKIAVAFAALFVGTLIVASIAAVLLSKLVKWVGMGSLDRQLGALFGMLRGVLVIMALILLAGMTMLPQEPFWRDAALSRPLQKLARVGLVMLPDSVAQRVYEGLKN